jgi:hypothetical protein
LATDMVRRRHCPRSRLATARFLALAFVLTTAFYYCERRYDLLPLPPPIPPCSALAALPPENRVRVAIIYRQLRRSRRTRRLRTCGRIAADAQRTQSILVCGPGNNDGSLVLHVGGSADRLRRPCRSVDVVGSFGGPC